MKNQVLFSSKDKSKKIKCRLLLFLYGALRVKNETASQVMFFAFIEANKVGKRLEWTEKC